MEKRLSRDVTTKNRRLTGYAARFGSTARIGDFSETIRPGAFARTLESDADVVAILDHDPSKLLARRSSGTLRLTEDAYGLRFEIDMPPTTMANDLLALVERGDVHGMSFGFRVRPGGDQWSADRTQRTLTDVELVEISVAQSWAAYSDTSVHARTRQGTSDDAWELRVRLMEQEADRA